MHGQGQGFFQAQYPSAGLDDARTQICYASWNYTSIEEVNKSATRPRWRNKYLPRESRIANSHLGTTNQVGGDRSRSRYVHDSILSQPRNGIAETNH